MNPFLGHRPPLIAVIGDYMTDKYWIGSSTRLSAEAPVPIVKVQEVLSMPGGAGNVYRNLETLGAYTTVTSGRGAIVKNRLMVGDTQVARWDENDWLQPIEPHDVQTALERASVVVVADYGKGSIDWPVLKVLRECNLPMLVDTKRQPSDYPAHALFFPNAAEYAMWDSDPPHVLRKRGAQGLELETDGFFAVEPARARFVRSVNGAGDTVIAAYAYATLIPGLNPLQFASAAAAIVVERPYTATATCQEVLDRMKEYGNPNPEALAA